MKNVFLTIDQDTSTNGLGVNLVTDDILVVDPETDINTGKIEEDDLDHDTSVPDHMAGIIVIVVDLVADHAVDTGINILEIGNINALPPVKADPPDHQVHHIATNHIAQDIHVDQEATEAGRTLPTFQQMIMISNKNQK